VSTGGTTRGRAPDARRALSRREFLKLGGAAFAGATVLGVPGCGGGERSEGPVRLTFSHGPEGAEIWQRQIKQFNQQNEGDIQVELRQAPTDTDQYFDQLRTEFQAGSAGVDVISGDVIWPAQFAARGWILNLSNRFTQDLREMHLPATVASNTYQDKVYGVPWYTDAGMLYYRMDLLEESGFSEPPKTWDELKEQAQKARRDSRTKHGFVFQGAEYEGGVVNALEYIWTHGGYVLEDPDEEIVDAPRTLEGLKTARDLVESRAAPEAVSSYKEWESYAIFLGGDAVFMRNWPFAYKLSADPSISSVEPEQIGVAELPVAAEGDPSYSGLGGWNLMINSASENVDEAWAFIQYLSAPEQQKTRVLEGGYLPTSKDLYEDAEILENVPVISSGKEVIENVRSRPVSPFYSDMSLMMAEQFNALLEGSTSPEEATEKLGRDLKEIVDKEIGRVERASPSAT
jgi:multiple sugar transport system substrate-binding protein